MSNLTKGYFEDDYDFKKRIKQNEKYERQERENVRRETKEHNGVERNRGESIYEYERRSGTAAPKSQTDIYLDKKDENGVSLNDRFRSSYSQNANKNPDGSKFTGYKKDSK